MVSGHQYVIRLRYRVRVRAGHGYRSEGWYELGGVPRNLSSHLSPSHLPAAPPSPTASSQLSPSSSQLLLATPPLSYLQAISQLPPARSAEPGSSTWPCRRSPSTHSTGPSRKASSETDRSASQPRRRPATQPRRTRRACGSTRGRVACNRERLQHERGGRMGTELCQKVPQQFYTEH